MSDKQENRQRSGQGQPQNRPASQERRSDQGYTEGRQGRSNRKKRGGRVQEPRDKTASAPKERTNQGPKNRSNQTPGGAGAGTGTPQAGAPQREAIKGQAGQRQPRSRNRKHFVADENKQNKNEQGNQARTNRYDNRSDNRQDNRPDNRQDNRSDYRNRPKQQGYNYQKESKMAETMDDIKRDNDRIEKEIWLEIADIHTIKLDF